MYSLILFLYRYTSVLPSYLGAFCNRLLRVRALFCSSRFAALAGVSWLARRRDSVSAVIRSAALAWEEAGYGCYGWFEVSGAGAGVGDGTEAPLEAPCI